MKIAPYVLALVLCISCSTVNDDEPPVIDRFNLNQTTVEAGGSLEVDIRVRDNRELTQLRLRIREAFSKSFEPWSEQFISFIGGSEFSSIYAFQLPDSSLSGYYEVSLQVVDERGNASIDSLKPFNVFLKQFSPQLMNFQTTPPIISGNLIQLFDDDTLIMSGLAVDDTLLAEVEVELRSASNSQLMNDTYNLVADSIFSWDFSQNADSIFFSTVSDTPVKLVIKLTDIQGHLTRDEFEIEILN
jgi:hypothetical protein